MIRHDLTHWPLVLSVAQGSSTLEEQLAFFQQWSEWLGRGETFATLRVFSDSASLERPAGGGKEAKTWLQQHGEAIKRDVAAMATVVPPACLDGASRMNAEKLFGVPAQTFAGIEAALDWTGAQVVGRRLRIDLDAAHATLKRLMVE